MNAHRTEDLVKVLKALGDVNRLNIVMSIDRKALSVSEIIRATGLSQTLVSFHLRALREANVVTTKRNGPFIHYSLSDRALTKTLLCLAKSAHVKEAATEEEILPLLSANLLPRLRLAG